MNPNRNIFLEKLKFSSQDGQGRWDEMLSPTQVLTGQEKNQTANVKSDNINIAADDNNDDEEVSESKDDNLLIIETEEAPIKSLLKPLEEQILSQNLNQLSTSHQTTELLRKVNEDKEENLPYYLKKGNESFEQVISQVTSKDMIEELRQMAILIYQISLNNLENSLWMAYLKAGTGKLKLIPMDNNNNNNNNVGRQIWPKEIRLLIDQSTNENVNTACLIYATQHLCELDNKMLQYQTELNMKKKKFSDYLQIIDTYVQQGLEYARMKTKHQILLVQYNYNDCVLELEYLQHNPTQHQKQIAKELCHAKYQEEITKEENNSLKRRYSIHDSSQSFELAQEKLFNSIDDQNIHQKLNYHQSRKVPQQVKQDMIKLYLSTAETQMNRYNKRFNAKLKQFWIEQRSLPNDEKLSTMMFNLIEQRFKNISESIKCVYQYKADLIRLNSIH